MSIQTVFFYAIAWFLVAITPGPAIVCVILLICTLLDVVVLVSYACLAERGMRSLRSSRLSAWLERTFGAALMIFGVRLFFWQR